MKNKINKNIWHYIDLFIGGVFLYLLDRFIKLGFLKSPNTFGDFLYWLPFSKEFYENYGIFFGWLIPLWFVISVSVVIIAIVIYYLSLALRRSDWLQIIAWSLIIVGGLSNLYDRVVYNFVIDWWVMPWQAVINLADVYITVGIVILLLNLQFFKKPSKM